MQHEHVNPNHRITLRFGVKQVSRFLEFEHIPGMSGKTTSDLKLAFENDARNLLLEHLPLNIGLAWFFKAFVLR